MTRFAQVFWLLAAWSPTALADIDVRRIDLGFPAGVASSAVYRSGSWCPAAVEIVLTGEEARNVRIHIEQWDLDGDIVFHDVFTSLTRDVAGRIHWLYFIPNPDNSPGSEGFKLQVLDHETGEALRVTYNRELTHKVRLRDQPELLGAETYLILNIADGTAGYVMRMEDYGAAEPRYTKSIVVSHIGPDRVPDHWHGLEMVDAIFWDGADPSSLSEAQARALVEWVERGGRLVITASGTAPELAASPLHAVLPVELQGSMGTASDVPERLLRLVWDRVRDDIESEPTYLRFQKPVRVAEATARPQAVAAIRSAAGTRTYAARCDVGMGSVTYCAITVQDIFDNGGDPEEFFKRALWLRRRNPDVDQARLMGTAESIDLLQQLRKPIDFQTRATLYLFIIMVFVVAYGLVATFGMWFVLKYRGLEKYSWPAFGVVVAVASLLSLAAVRVNAGIGRKLDQLTIVDSSVDTYLASGRCFFGLKTSTMDEVDLWLPGGVGSPSSPDDQPNPGFLRPMSPRLDVWGSQPRFADTQRYESRTRQSVLEDVPIRATLKQFEGCWQGGIDGQLHAEIRLNRSGGAGTRIAQGSSITNDLGHELLDCFLFEAQLPPDYGNSRNQSILVHYLPRISNGEKLSLDELVISNSALDKQAVDKLQELHKVCIGGLQSQFGVRQQFAGRTLNLESAALAALLLTSYTEYAPNVQTSFYGRSDPPLLQTNCRLLDRSSDIRPDQLLLVGFSPEPGPVRLRERRGNGEYEAIGPRNSLTIYRFTIPVKARG